MRESKKRKHSRSERGTEEKKEEEIPSKQKKGNIKR